MLIGFTIAEAQIKIKQSGKVIVGSELSGNDANNVLNMQILGNGSGRGGSKLAFGDFGRYEVLGWNVFI